MALTLYTRDADGSVKAVIAAKAGGLDLTVLPIAQYTGSADASQAPVLTGAGADVTGFDAIKAVAVAANAPVGNEDLLAIERDVLAAPAAALRKMHADRAPYVPAQYDAALAQIVDGLAQVERVLASGGDAASGGAGGEKLTLAEICLVATLHPLFAKALGPEARAKAPRTTALFERAAARGEALGVLGKPVLCAAVTLPNVGSSGGDKPAPKAEASAGAAKPRSSRSAPKNVEMGPPQGSPEEIAAADAAASAQGAAVAALKTAKKEGDASATDDVIKAEVAKLLAMKKEADRLRGVVEKPAGGKGKAGSKPAGGKPKEDKNKKGSKETGLGLNVSMEEDFGAWYSQVVVAGELIEYYDISGCYILRPWAYSIWERIKDFFDAEIKKQGVENCYFPLFVSAARLEAEKDHIEDFAPEVAWVTRSGQSELDVPIAVRPTSETVMYPVFANWIRSHRDLPMKINQWCNVVRWEFKHPTPFIRSREFLWQEGHTAFAGKSEADLEVRRILELYRRVYEELLAVPVVPGVKSEKEKFAGGLYTTTVEAFIPQTGRGIQGATSHCLGQNFAKMFQIEFENKTGGRSMPWQNSWGCTTRTIGVAIMVHGDDKGLVLPPRVAPQQVVVVTIPNTKLSPEDAQRLRDTARAMTDGLLAGGTRAKLDDRDNYTPGWKYNHWELKGVPLRVEFGPRDMEAGHCVVVRRDTGAKETVRLDALTQRAAAMCEEMQADMLARATQRRNESVVTVTSWDGFVEALDERKMVLTPWCETKESEELVKKRTQGESEGGAAKTLCIPFTQPPLSPGTKCFVTGAPATTWVLWGRSY